jgi:hypothetical protein
MKRSALVVAAFAGLLAGCKVTSDAPVTGGIARFILRGKVTNLTGTALQSVTVQVQPVGGGTVVRTMLTDASGTYRTFGLQAGLYRVEVVMGDSSRITATGRKDTVYVGVSAESTIVGTISYDPGKIISGSLTYTYQDTAASGAVSVGLRGVMVRLKRRTAAAPAPGVFVQVDSIRSSATGAYRFAVRVQAAPGDVFQLQFDTTEAAVFPSGFRAAVDSSIPNVNVVDTTRVTAAFAANVTTAATASLTFRAPYTSRARIFKDRCAPQPCTPDGVYRALATDPDTVVSGVRVWLRKAGSTTNFGSGTVTSGAGATLVGNFSITTLRNRTNWTLHLIPWSLPTGCTISAAKTLTAEGDVAVTPEFGPLATTLAAVAIPAGNDIPLTCP